MNNNSFSIEYFDRRFAEKMGITGICKTQQLYSKKNSVNKVTISFRNNSMETYVLKEYKGEDSYSRSGNESFFYNVLKSSDLRIPAVFYRNGALLIMQFLGDETLLDYITTMELENNEVSLEECSRPENFKIRYKPMTDACCYIYDFNKTLKKTRGKSFILNDMNLRNFLLPGKKIYRVDFEDCRPGTVEEDFGKFIAFFLTYKPSFTFWKLCISECIKNFCRISLGLDTGMINLEIDRELESMRKRRTR